MGGTISRLWGGLAASAVAGSLLLAVATPAQALENLTPIDVQPIADPSPVLGADGRRHLEYELRLTNLAGDPVTVDSVQALRGAKPLNPPLAGDALTKVMRINADGMDTTIPGGGGATIFMDVVIPRSGKFPKVVRHRFAITRNSPPPNARSLTFAGPRVTISDFVAPVLDAPLRGGRWVIGNGCCDEPNAHRGTTLPIDGTIHTPERFAIDFVQLTPDLAPFAGPAGLNDSYPAFGQTVHAVAPGRVVGRLDGLPEQIPGALPEGQTAQTAGGNHLVIKIAPGQFAFYAHMQPGSLRVRVGDTVKTGQAIGRLGNTGNTDAAHLHFHLMDGKSPLGSNSLPYKFRTFAGQGVVVDVSQFVVPAPMTIDTTRWMGRIRGALPMNNQIVQFPGPTGP